MSALALADDFTFAELYDAAGLARLDARFLDWLAAEDTELAGRLRAARGAPEALDAIALSQLLVELAPRVERFLARLFGIEKEAAELTRTHDALGPLYECKRLFVQRRAAKKIKADAAEALDAPALEAALEGLLGGPVTEIGFAAAVMGWLADEEANAAALETALQFAAWAAQSEAGKRRFAAGMLFKTPSKRDYEALVPVETYPEDGTDVFRLPAHDLRARDGFALTDEGADLPRVLDQTNYCIFCHDRGKDSCSHGVLAKEGGFGTNPFDEALIGCPLDEKISEMNMVKAQGFALGALAIVTLDNPMCAGTGHHICNDCMKGCIYQKQEPVDVPQIETRVLKDVLGLPWGVEIYSLLTRWNPLNLSHPVPKPASGRKVLIAGLGPAGYTLAHYLLNDGHAVLAIDGLKIEPLAPEISGVAASGARVPFEPIRDLDEISEPLESRVMAGFGGVAEYGITVRWNKNFLKILRLLVERRAHFALAGGVRLGGQLSIATAFEAGFDHVALALGAGRPTIPDMPNKLAPGVRAASDFLMALQLTGAAQTDSTAACQIRLPAVVVGGGLTAVDAATESAAYYVVQVERFLARYETLADELGEAAARAGWSEEDADIAEAFLAHGRAVRVERAQAEKEDRAPDLRGLIREWGGVTIAYRKRLIDSPMYRLNPEEVEFALEEGFRFAEGLSPARIETDRFGAAQAIAFERQALNEDGRMVATGERVTLPARTVLFAAGTSPNTVIAREEPDLLALDGGWFQAVDDAGASIAPERLAKPTRTDILAAKRADGRAVSFYGDTHPSFAGNVVKAMASAKRGAPQVSAWLAAQEPVDDSEADSFLARITEGLRARIERVETLAPGVVELVVRAPAAARAYRPGQFFRLQNFETRARRGEGPALVMEGLALAGAWADAEAGLIGAVVIEAGGSSRIAAKLAPGEPVVFMGPTGTALEIPSGETVLLAASGYGLGPVAAVGRAMREAGCKVLIAAGAKTTDGLYARERLEDAADAVLWACEDGAPPEPARETDRAFTGDLVAALGAYGNGELGEPTIRLSDVVRVVAIGSERMMAALAAARHGALVEHLGAAPIAIAGVNSSMQCMMKEVCAQCLQPQTDPATGEERLVFSCFDQNQPMDAVNFAALGERLAQNALSEKLSDRWVARAFGGPEG
jgi:NADPH-dependent glutamate synthase beta subunit-like oxidoreductase/NAD(P)H-flavin reductase